MNACIRAIGTANPAYKTPQNKIADFMARAHQMQGRQKDRLLALYRATGIRFRYSVLKDYGLSPDRFEFYPADFEPFPSTAKRAAVFRSESLPLAVQAVNDCLPSGTDPLSITHLVTVSCTGLYAPGLDIELVKALDLRPDIQRTAINFMGCYAAFNALKMAQAICGNNLQARVLIVCVELCSIHFQKEPHEDFLLANALFGDGAAAVLLENDPPQRSMELLAAHCDIVDDGFNEMAWQVGDLGFEMRLSRYVPDLIAQGINKLTSRLLQKVSWDLPEIDYFAIHPGGKKILECIQQALAITPEQNRFSYQVLREFGNMSSPTILFVLKEIWNKLNEEDRGKKILCFAFGPGLTMESLVLQITP